MVGDRLREDVAARRPSGWRLQALWFADDDSAAARRPTRHPTTPADVLRWLGAT